MTREVSYGTTSNGNESTNLLRWTSSPIFLKTVESSSEKAKSQQPQNLLSTLLCLIIFRILGYLVCIAHQILNELQSSKIAMKPSWSKAVTEHIASQAHFSLIDAPTKSEEVPALEELLLVLIVYVPDDEGPLLMASKVAKGVKSVSNANVITEPVSNASFEQVLEADAIILGSSVENGNTHPLLQGWINEHWDLRRDLSKKVGAAFVAAGGISAGQESTLHSLTRALMIFRMIISWWKHMDIRIRCICNHIGISFYCHPR